MTIRCPRKNCLRTFDTEYNARIYDKDKGHGYICPFCYHFVDDNKYSRYAGQRDHPRTSKKERRRQREAIKPATPAKESA
jgi:hypothetical protein